MSGSDAYRRHGFDHSGGSDGLDGSKHLADVNGGETLADVAARRAQRQQAGESARRGRLAVGPAELTASAESQLMADSFARLRALGETAHAVGAALGLMAAELAASEAFDRVERVATLLVEQAAALDPLAVGDWFDALGDDLELALSLEGLDTTFDPVSAELRFGDDPAAVLAAFQEQALAVAATQGDSVSVGVRLRIGKAQALRLAARALVERRAEERSAAPETALVFYSAAASERLLTLRALVEWERRGLGAQTRLCVILCDAAGALAGPALELIGVGGVSGAALESPESTESRDSIASAASAASAAGLPVSREAWRRFAEQASAARRLRDAESAWTSWSGAPLALMPDHLRVIAREPAPEGLERVAARLRALRRQVAACALASHVERGERVERGDLLLRFAGARPASVWLSSGELASADIEDSEAAEAIIGLADWAYRDASPDKLAIARQALADTLPAGATVPLAQLAAAAGPALDAARTNFAIYLRGATERYFQLRAAAQQAVSGFAEATRAAVASLTSDITDNLFRTVGLIVGVIIAWLIQPSASLTLVKIAAALYTGYVAFIMLYLLRARQARYHLERQGLDDTLAAMAELTAAERERLRKPALDAEAHFERYYRLTRVIYATLAVAGALLFVLMFTPLGQVIVPAVPVAPHTAR